MSKRKVRRVNEETYDISLHNEIFIPDVSIKYGAYKEHLIEDSSSESDHDEQKTDIHEVVINNQDDGYDIIDNDVGMMTLDDYLEPLEDDNVIYDEKIKLDYVFFKSVQSGYAEQLGFENPKYIRPIIIVDELPRPIKNKYVSLGIHSTSQLKYWNHPSGITSQKETPYWNELCGMLRKLNYTPITLEKDELFGNPPYWNGLPSKANNKLNMPLI
jgi:hypothetical protein